MPTAGGLAVLEGQCQSPVGGRWACEAHAMGGERANKCREEQKEIRNVNQQIRGLVSSFAVLRRWRGVRVYIEVRCAAPSA